MQHIVAHYHEIGLKGKNRSKFEERLVVNIKKQLSGLSVRSVQRKEGRVLIVFEKELKGRLVEQVKEQLARVFGIVSFSPVEVVSAKMEAIEKSAIKLMQAASPSSFAVRAKRSNKQFPKTSEQVNQIIGRAILDKVGGKVNLTKPKTTLFIEILSKQALLSTEKHAGPGGLPVGVSGKVVAMLSGGIDSPVAAWKIMKRGCEVIFLHFHSYPHTNKASINKVKDLAQLIGSYQPESKLILIPFAEAQRQIVMQATAKYRVLLYRRLMFRLAEKIVKDEGALAIVTGESLGQVASQTIPNLRAIEAVTDLPVFRPLIGDDKDEIIKKAKELGTFEISIQPHDDCCSLFLPKNPATRARVEDLEKEEAKLSNNVAQDFSPEVVSNLKV